ncbi:MAG TPA: MarR family transcriptional regulator [Acidimicrobiales bacterium]|nr:MarR family transcriptional regulator [Acidimicrobiales bacterium]
MTQAATNDISRRPTGPPTLESEIGFRMGRSHRLLRDAWAGQIADLELTPPQAALLRVICERPGVGLREAARLLHTDPTNTKHLADHLERTGLVHSEPDPAHRQRRGIHPSKEGLALAREVAGRAHAWHRRLSKLIGTAEMDRLQGLLGHLEQVLEVETATIKESGGSLGAARR